MHTKRATPILVAAAALFVLTGGYVHLREWLDRYRHVPAAAPGAFVVRVGFPINAVVSVVLAAALVACLVRWHGATAGVAVAALGFEAASLGSLLLSRNASVLGWMETGWSRGAEQALAVELGAILSLLLVAVLVTAGRREVALSS